MSNYYQHSFYALAYVHSDNIPHDKLPWGPNWISGETVKHSIINFSPGCVLYCYKHGRGITADREKCISILQRAVELGQSTAQNDSGIITVYTGVPTAYYNMGHFYEMGKNFVDIDRFCVVAWYKLGTEAGHLESYYRLALLYLSRSGIQKDKKEAFELGPSETTLRVVYMLENATSTALVLFRTPTRAFFCIWCQMYGCLLSASDISSVRFRCECAAKWPGIVERCDRICFLQHSNLLTKVETICTLIH